MYRPPAENKPWNFWYSAEQFAHTGRTNFALLMDGREVEYTEARENGGELGDNYKWTDAEYLGAGLWLRAGQKRPDTVWTCDDGHEHRLVH